MLCVKAIPVIVFPVRVWLFVLIILYGVCMIRLGRENEIADEYFSQANGTASILLVSLGYTSLQFDQPQPFAVFAMFVSLAWLLSVGGPYRRILRYYLPDNAPPSRYFYIAWRLKIFIVSLAFVLAVALGMTAENIYSVLGYN